MSDTDKKSYDSFKDTSAHIAKVCFYMGQASANLHSRAMQHDASKLEEPEKSAFDKCNIRLAKLVYGSDEYRAALAEIRPALQHHYDHNSHHPEHFKNGVNGMSLFDVLEMLIDWKASTERMKDGSGSIQNSLIINQERFQIGEQLASILQNTIQEMGWTTSANNELQNVRITEDRSVSTETTRPDNPEASSGSANQGSDRDAPA